MHFVEPLRLGNHYISADHLWTLPFGLSLHILVFLGTVTLFDMLLNNVFRHESNFSLREFFFGAFCTFCTVNLTFLWNFVCINMYLIIYSWFTFINIHTWIWRKSVFMNVALIFSLIWLTQTFFTQLIYVLYIYKTYVLYVIILLLWHYIGEI